MLKLIGSASSLVGLVFRDRAVTAATTLPGQYSGALGLDYNVFCAVTRVTFIARDQILCESLKREVMSSCRR